MKTFFKLIVAVAALGFATANAQNNGNSGGGNSSKQTPGQAAAIKAVEDAAKTGNAETAAEAMSQAVQAFPEMAGALIKAGIGASPSVGMITDLAYAAGFAAPGSLTQIISSIQSMKGTITSLVAQASGGGSRGNSSANIRADQVIGNAIAFAMNGASLGGISGGGETEEGGDGSSLPPVVEASAP